jgi:glycine/D-amino acid oxidase-like deaminating enzyme
MDVLVTEASDPYLYLRDGPDGSIICGGEDEPFSDDRARDALLPQKVEAIRAKLARLIPGVETKPAFAWAGSFGESATGLPSIGPLPGAPGCYAVLGFGGNGMIYAEIAAEILEVTFAGGRDPDADLYATP